MSGPVRASAAFVLVWAAGVLLILWVRGWAVVCPIGGAEACDSAARNRPAMISLGGMGALALAAAVLLPVRRWRVRYGPWLLVATGLVALVGTFATIWSAGFVVGI
ncbi:hypothetical protein [Leifsonia sp. NPDC080035]|uniref:Uncharacterized protein n=1 Tax=Leifsonia sp. NPDC080035 TaxID=3143936 RepID=A0AAU7GBL1_9MICO